jgi:leader peptidase (prepilin peptidase) / N-methyltransferase
MIPIFATLFAALVGLAFGSFLNVCVTRWPAGESVVKPRSHCRSCARALAWWENIPLVSWLALRGHCRTCGASIGLRYPLVELAVGASWALVLWQTVSQLNALTAGIAPLPISFSPRFLIELDATVVGELFLAWVLIGLAALDAEFLWLPDIVTLPGIALGIVFTLLRGDPFTGEFSPHQPALQRLLHIAFAILIAAGLVLIIRWTYRLVRRRDGMGLGDAKLMAMLAAWLGLPGALLSFGIGVVLATIAAFALLALPTARRGLETWAATKLPLGTFLCIGGLVSTLWGQQIIAAYLHWAGF